MYFSFQLCITSLTLSLLILICPLKSRAKDKQNNLYKTSQVNRLHTTITNNSHLNDLCYGGVKSVQKSKYT